MGLGNIGPLASCLAKYNVKTNKYHHPIFHKRNVLIPRESQDHHLRLKDSDGNEWQ